MRERLKRTKKFKVGDKVVPTETTLSFNLDILTKGKVYEVIETRHGAVVEADNGRSFWSLPHLAFDKYVESKNIVGGNILWLRK